MAVEVPEFIAANIQKAADELVKAIDGLPEDKRSWSVEGKGRSALNQVAECALMNGDIAALLSARKWNESYSFDDFHASLLALAQNWPAAKEKLRETTAELVGQVRSLDAQQLGSQLEMPWGPMSLSEIANYQVWNMTYHLGQINYIASLV